MISIMLTNSLESCRQIIYNNSELSLRRSVPKIETPFKCYIYCSLIDSKRFMYSLFSKFGEYEAVRIWNSENWSDLKGKVIGEFICDEVYTWPYNDKAERYDIEADDANRFNLHSHDLFSYGKGNLLRGLHITDLKIYDTPRSINEFGYVCSSFDTCENCDNCDYHYYSNTPSSGIEEACTCDGVKTLKRAPRSWCYVEELCEDRITEEARFK